MRGLKWIALAGLLALGACQGWAWSHYRGSMPDGLGIWWRSYANNQAWDFGPGGNETGFNEFLLPAGSADRVAAGGLDYLATLRPIRHRHGWHGDWMPTPIPAEAPWVVGPGTRSDAELPPGTVSVLAYLDRYGFFIEIPELRRARFDAAIRAPGSFYAYGHGGRVIVVSPPQGRAWVAYSG